ncbi:MAG: hypothetical protein IPM37_16685 [Hahellaceae bacterium]|nr:hypothetical protein [Hahellaceae bacterium]
MSVPLSNNPAAVSSHLLPKGIWIIPVLLVAASMMLEGSALFGAATQRFVWQGSVWLGVVEMVLIGALLMNGIRIREWVKSAGIAGPKAHRATDLCLFSLILCALGDLVNRNFSGTYFAYDDIIEHSYLVDSVWFFLPGYSVYLLAAWQTTRLPSALKAVSLVVAGGAGLVSFLGMVLPQTSEYIVAVTGLYAVVITTMVAVAFWIALSWRHPLGYLVAGGAALASVADAIIGQFWLYGHGYYPAVAHINWIVYFLSQALIQQLPVLLALHDR